MNKELHITIIGRVQGVNFRNEVAKIAQNNKIAGYVEHTQDGDMLIVAQAETIILEKFLNWCQKGIFPAKVKGMSYEWKNLDKQFDKFRIKRKASFIEDEVSSLKNLGKSMLGLHDEIKVPKHVVIIPDGNRRWAREKGWHPWVGHRRAIAKGRLESIFKECQKLDIEYLSMWGFSTENWDRDKKEIKYLFDIFRKFVSDLEESFHKDKIRFRLFGRRDRFPEDIVLMCERLEKDTKDYSNFNFQLCLDSGGRDDLVRAFNKMIKNGVKEVDEKMISKNLDSSETPDPDFIIRTSGEQRTSGIMAFQSVYAELYFSKACFPDFDAMHFRRAILDFSARTRRFGGTAKADLQCVNAHTLIDPDMINK